MKENWTGFKLICTVGPSSRSPAVLRQMEELGASLFRINLSHTPLEELEPLVREIRAATEVPICLDTEGAQIRTGRMTGERVNLSSGQTVHLVPEEAAGDTRRMALYPPEAVSILEPGMVLWVDFDTCVLSVQEKEGQGVRAEVVSGGQIGSNKGVAVDREISLAPLTQKDRRAVALARRLGIRFYSYSFCADAAAVRLLREMVGKDSSIISKIENRSALLHLEEIIGESDALLIDRGDLSRSISLEEIPAVQKWIVGKARQRQIPVTVATNLLENMVDRPYPTRAEINDIANTLLDGTSGLVLAAETAVGKYPVECVRMMMRMVRRYHSQGGGVDPFVFQEPKASKTERSPVIWLTGLSGSGKSTIAALARARLQEEGIRVGLLEGDDLRRAITRTCGFTRADIEENNRVIARLCREERRKWDLLLVAVISPFEQSRRAARSQVGEPFAHVYVKVCLETVMRRDPKGLYRRAREGSARHVVGYSAEVPYEVPARADLVLDTERKGPEVLAEELVEFVHCAKA